MNTQKFQKLIQSITGRNLVIKTNDENIVNGKEYFIAVMLPLTGERHAFKWKVALTDEKILRSFITAFCTKHREPDPKSYDYSYGGKEYRWADRTPLERENAYCHHASHMYNKAELLEQVQANFSKPEIEQTLIRYGFYTTEYGIGIFAFWQTDYVRNAIDKLKSHLQGQSIPFSNEFSDARWVYRFKLNLTKEAHNNILNSFN